MFFNFWMLSHSSLCSYWSYGISRPARRKMHVFCVNVDTPPISAFKALAVNQIPTLATGIPAFVGYTETSTDTFFGNLRDTPFKIASLEEYETHFGNAAPETSIGVAITDLTPGGASRAIEVTPPHNKQPFLMYYSMQLYFSMGGGPCYIVSVGCYSSNSTACGSDARIAASDVPRTGAKDLTRGLNAVASVSDVTLLAFPDATALLGKAEFYGIYNEALAQCAALKDRFTLVDVLGSDIRQASSVEDLRDEITSDPTLGRYGSAFYPFLRTLQSFQFDAEQIVVEHFSHDNGTGYLNGRSLKDLEGMSSDVYELVVAEIKSLSVVLPPSSAIAGLMAHSDATRGVWTGLANARMQGVANVFPITNADNLILQAHDSGKAVNAIRSFGGVHVTGLYGVRTLSANAPDWWFFTTTRFFSWLHKSLKQGVRTYAFEPNTSATWINTKSDILSFLHNLWKMGALPGSAFDDGVAYVRVGLGETMTQADIEDKVMKVEIGVQWPVAQSEYIVLNITQPMML